MDPFHFGHPDPGPFHETDLATDSGSKKSAKKKIIFWRNISLREKVLYKKVGIFLVVFSFREITDPRIRIRIHINMKWIRNTAFNLQFQNHSTFIHVVENASLDITIAM